ncbi:YciI family protein [Streptomyces diastatochromogenes]|nr:YciI family protein [Streptomyces diastatochromogenes]
MGLLPGRGLARGDRPPGGLQRQVPRERRAARRVRPRRRGRRPARPPRGRRPAVTDGPYLETKEYLASFYLLDCESPERARQIAADMPFADVEPVELWPVLHESAADV